MVARLTNDDLTCRGMLDNRIAERDQGGGYITQALQLDASKTYPPKRRRLIRGKREHHARIDSYSAPFTFEISRVGFSRLRLRVGTE